MLVAALPSFRSADSPRNLSLVEAAKLRSIICLDQPCPSYLVSAADALDAGRQVDEAQVDARIDAVVPQDVGLILYTSGTTANPKGALIRHRAQVGNRSEEHTSELQSLMRISYAVFCLKKKN